MWKSIVRDSVRHPNCAHYTADHWQFVGQFINHFSEGRLLPYPEQKKGYVLPDKYNRLPRAETKRSDGGMTVSPTDTIDASLPDTAVPTETEHQVALDLSGRPREEEIEVPKGVILVEWDGKDDPENPQNWCAELPRGQTD